jgi:hypothetical protein
MFARSAPVSPGSVPRDQLEIDVGRQGLAARVHVQDLGASLQVGRLDQDLPVEAAGAQERRIEILQPVRRAHDDHLVARPEAVQLDEELVQRLILFAVERVAAARAADGVELVDEDDRGRIVARLLEQLANPRGAEPGEHLDERRCALSVEARTRLVGDGLRRQRLAGPGRSVEEDAFRYARAEPFEPLRVAQEVDDLQQLGLRLVEAGHLVPRHRGRGAGRDLCRLDARHQLHGPPEEVDDDQHQHEEEDGEPGRREVAGDRADRGNHRGAHRHAARHPKGEMVSRPARAADSAEICVRPWRRAAPPAARRRP